MGDNGETPAQSLLPRARTMAGTGPIPDQGKGVCWWWWLVTRGRLVTHG